VVDGDGNKEKRCTPGNGNRAGHAPFGWTKVVLGVLA
jgi:hypothetical protein